MLGRSFVGGARSRTKGSRSKNMAVCHNCGLPEKALSNPGHTLRVTSKAENNFHRDRKVGVWVCCDECAVQALGVSKYGPATHKWPVTLSQFRSTRPLRDLETPTVPRGAATLASGKRTAENRI
jgi:hypothetical protein